MPIIAYTVLSLGQHKLHQLHNSDGKFFVMGEVATQLFQQTPTSFLQELRKGKYSKANSSDEEVLQTIVELGLQVEGAASHAGVVLLPPKTVEQLLVDKRRPDLLQPFRLAMLKLASQEAARLMASGDYDSALPVALEAVTLGEQLFKPQPALQLFPLYLLAAQANLGLRRAAQCEKCLALASLLTLKEPDNTTSIMRSQLSRLFGQLWAFQGKTDEALKAFAEDVYYCSLEYGPQDARTTLGYYNLSKVLQSTGATDSAMACSDMVVGNWMSCLQRCLLGVLEDGQPVPPGTPVDLPVGRLQLAEVVEMLLDIGSQRAAVYGSGHLRVAEAHMAAALVFAEIGEAVKGMEQLSHAKKIVESSAGCAEKQQLLLRQIEPYVSSLI